MMAYSIVNKNRNAIFYSVVLVLLLFLTGCLNGPTSTTSGGTPFTVELWASAKCVKAGDTLTVRAIVTNHDSRTHLVELKDQPVLDLFIGYRTPTGSTSISWSNGKPLTIDLTRLELQPGQSKSIEMQWVVIDPAPSAIGVSARFFDDSRFLDHPLSPVMVIYGPGTCPGPFGP